MVEHPLYSQFEVQTVERFGPRNPKVEFKDLLNHVCTLSTLENVSYFLHHLKPIEEIVSITDINIFKKGIQPLWEDENNICGGKWIIKLRKDVTKRIFEKFVIRMVSRPFNTFEINGIVLSIRFKHVIFAIWTRDTQFKEKFKTIINEIKSAIGVDFFVSIEYKDNDESIKDLSSYKNTINISNKKGVKKH